MGRPVSVVVLITFMFITATPTCIVTTTIVAFRTDIQQHIAMGGDVALRWSRVFIPSLARLSLLDFSLNHTI